MGDSITRQITTPGLSTERRNVRAELESRDVGDGDDTKTITVKSVQVFPDYSRLSTIFLVIKGLFDDSLNEETDAPAGPGLLWYPKIRSKIF